MRRLVLMLNILVGSALLAQPAHLLAASAETNGNKDNHQHKHASHLRGKSKDSQFVRVKQKKLQNPGDVWERIRAGMQIPRPSPVGTLPDQANANGNSLPKSSINHPHLHASIDLHPVTIDSSNIITSTASPFPLKARAERILARQKLKLPISASMPVSQYTPYGRLKLNAFLSSRIRNNLGQPAQSMALKYAILHEDTAGQSRFHTRIDLHPKSQDIGIKNPIEPMSSNSEPLAKPLELKRPYKSVFPYKTAVVRQDLAGLIPSRNNQAIKYDRVYKHIVWYTQHRDYLRQVAERAHPYLYHIVETLSENKLPHELALLPIVESAYQPTAQSPKSAAGLWQFIPSTGHDFDLHQSEQFDARLDIAASTQAAVRYLSFLKQHFNGDWLLALAAYNCGLGAVDNAISRNTAEGLDTDFWSLRLPEETQEYVPRFLALSSIFANPSAYGLKLAPVRNEPYFVKVKIDSKHDVNYLAEKNFKEIAELANLSYEQFNRLNPGYLNTKIGADGPFTFLMPVANANQLHQRLAKIASFMNEPPLIAASHAPLERNALPRTDESKTALSLLSDITLPKGADLATTSDPFLSLDLDANQTSPRIINQSALPIVDISSESKIIKKNI